MVRSVARDLPEQVKNNQSVNQAAGNGGQKMGQYSWFTVYYGYVSNYHDHQYEIDPEAAQVVKVIFTMAACILR